MTARTNTYSKAKGVFDKLWKRTFEDKPWLQLILQNTLYAFIETPGLTLVELPLFYRNHEFRNHIINNIQYNWHVRDYWRLTFASKSKHDQNEQMEAAQTRAAIMLAHEYILDIVGQTETTIDFTRILSENKIVLVRLSNRLSRETKTIIGTILVSELLHAIEHRPSDNPPQFCIFIDESQNFACYQDFPLLITQAPKYGIATTLAHHERYGQLAGNPEIMGATAAISNKVIFQVTARDASELAPELAERPPTETRAEEQYIISQYPVSDLLHWHDNASIRQFVNKYIRPMKERLQDIGGDIEGERLTRMDYLDIASMYRIDERLGEVSRIERDNRTIRGALSSAGQAIEAAGKQTRKLISLSDEADNLRLSIRALNKFLTAIMENRIRTGRQDFADYLIRSVYGMISLSDFEKKTINLYVKLMYSRCGVAIIPFEVADVYDLFPDLVAERKKEAQELRREKCKRFYECHYAGMRDEEGKYITRAQATARVIPKDIAIIIRGEQDEDKITSTIRRHNKGIIEMLEEFGKFCEILGKPENHIKVRSWQFVTKQINIRTEQDMVNETARELSGLPKYTAHAKVLEDQGRKIWKGRIRTIELGAKKACKASALETVNYVETRAKIHEEIAARHENLMRDISRNNEPPPSTC